MPKDLSLNGGFEEAPSHVGEVKEIHAVFPNKIKAVSRTKVLRAPRPHEMTERIKRHNSMLFEAVGTRSVEHMDKTFGIHGHAMS